MTGLNAGFAQPRISCFLLLFALALFLVTGCARAQVQPASDAVATPRLDGNHFLTADGQRLPLARWGPRDPDVVILGIHGFTDHGRSFTRLAIPLAEHRIAVYSYDQRGFGNTAYRGIWPGEAALVDDARIAWRLLGERYPDTPIILLGKSMGGAVSLLAVTGEDAITPDGVILISPAIWGRELMPWYQRLALWVGVRTIPGTDFDVRWARRMVDIVPTDDPDVRHEMDQDPLILREVRTDMLEGVTALMDSALVAVGELGDDLQGLIQYGMHDDIIPPDAACVMVRRLSAPARDALRLALYPDGYHMLTRDLQAEQTRVDIAAWAKNPEARLPSGHEVDFGGGERILCDE